MFQYMMIWIKPLIMFFFLNYQDYELLPKKKKQEPRLWANKMVCHSLNMILVQDTFD